MNTRHTHYCRHSRTRFASRIQRVCDGCNGTKRNPRNSRCQDEHCDICRIRIGEHIGLIDNDRRKCGRMASTTRRSEQANLQVISGYSESSDFRNGATEYSEMFLQTPANKVLGQNNYQAHRNIQFLAQTNAAGLTGTAETSEKIFMDLVGQSSDASDSMLCPFAGSGEGCCTSIL